MNSGTRCARSLFQRATSDPSLYGSIFLVAIMSAQWTGCGNTNPYVPATGKVKYADGTIPQGEISTITFQPKTSGPGAKGAQSTIEADGSFQLHSERPGDGAKPGEYFVTLHIMVGYPNGKSVVPLKYTKAQETPLSAEIKADGENHFVFTVERP